MKTFCFTVYLNGNGTTVEEAWIDATSAFSFDPGEVPDTYSEEELEEEE